MAVVDMSLGELREYRGISPRPEDFDEYWDKSLAEMRAVERNVEIRKSGFVTNFADCYDMYYTGVGGARIYAKLVKPKKISGKCPAVLSFHGYTGKSDDWYTMLGYAASGFVVAAMDCRGQGGLSQDVGGVVGNTLHGHIIRGLADKPEKLLYRQIYLDAAELAKIVMEMDEVDESRVATVGGSQGGGLAAACAALAGGVRRAAIIFPFLCDFKRVWQLDLETDAYIELRDYFRRFDPTHQNEDETFRKLGYIDIQNLAGRIKGEVLMIATLRDDVCPPSTQFAFYNKLDANKELVIYHDYSHEHLPGMFDRCYDFIKGLIA
ncbi:MAG: alpha/beta fold hydrolase [Phycisphaerae bacterium]|nr:alpha/beta fold hydrolase [Phycisphaerae bacterium]